MENHKENKAPVWAKVILGLFILISVFIIIGGVCLLMIGKETGGAVVCIAIGAVGLLFFGIGAFLVTHPGNSLGVGCLVGVGVLIGGGLTLAVLGAIFFSMLVQPFVDMEHYRQVWQNPVTVTATVTDHTSYDDEGDTDYRSFVTYIYNNVRYNDFLYEDRDKKEDLTPLGKTVAIQISPKDPTKQISRLKQNSTVAPFSVFCVVVALAGLCKLVHQYGLTKKGFGSPGMETIQEDMKAKIRGRMLRPFLLFCAVGYGFLGWRYSVVFGLYLPIIAAVCGVGWLWCLYTAVRDYRRVENGDFEVRRDVLVEKKEVSDSDGSSYYLVYETDGRNWKSSVSLAVYGQAKVGDVALAVYLPGKKKPIVHYDPEGNAR